MLKKIVTILSLILLFTISVSAQCPRNEVNCPGKCGRFYDENNDGYCDYGQVTISEENTTTTESTENVQEAIPAQSQKVEKQKVEKHSEKKVSNDESIPEEKTKNKEDSITKSENVNENISEAEVEKNEEKNEIQKYDLILITLITLVLYIISSILSKKKIIKKLNHRRLWNILLCITFLASAILGLLLVVQINYGICLGLYKNFLYLHVEFGIAMGIIGIIHLLWHIDYFKKIFSTNSPKKDNNE